MNTPWADHQLNPKAMCAQWVGPESSTLLNKVIRSSAPDTPRS
ncbi:MAG TPA: hypothetical protein VHZ51_29215 [Ktedonobacteraceae bacterium]|nr:hypothetical protein [Ktedonobacteraceae bacterium]